MNRNSSVARNSAPTALAKSSSSVSARVGRPSAIGFGSRPRPIAVLGGACAPSERSVSYFCWLESGRYGDARAWCQIIPKPRFRMQGVRAPGLACAPRSSWSLTADKIMGSCRQSQQVPRAGRNPPSYGTSMMPPD